MDEAIRSISRPADEAGLVTRARELTGGEDGPLGKEAAYELERIGRPAVPVLIELLNDGPDRAPEAAKVLVQIGEPAVPALLRAREAPDLRVLAEKALGEIEPRWRKRYLR